MTQNRHNLRNNKGQFVPSQNGDSLTRSQQRKLRKFQDRSSGDITNGVSDTIPHGSTFRTRRIVNGTVYYPNPDEAVRQSREEAETMALDLAIQQPLRERIDAVTQLNWRIEPTDDKKDKSQLIVAKELSIILNKTPRLLQLFSTLSNAVWHGKYAADMTYNWGSSLIDGKIHKFIGIVNHKPLHGDKLVFDEKDRIGIRVGLDNLPTEFANRVENVWTPDTRAVFLNEHERQFYAIHRHRISQDGPFEDRNAEGSRFGLGLRHYIYWMWVLKNRTLQSIMDHLQRFGEGVNIFYYEEGNDENQDEVEEAAENFTHNSYLVVPRPKSLQGVNQVGFEHIEVTGKGVEFAHRFIEEYFDNKIKTFIIGQTLSTEAHGTGLGSGVADLHRESKELIIRGDAINLAETVTEDILKPLYFANVRHNPEWPEIFTSRFVFDIETPDPEALLAAAKTLSELGVEIDKSELRGKVGFEEPENEESESSANTNLG
ncbi:DUF935 family protein [Candidatus Pacearchaeota archaeon]|nr:DUF935 family protein [Candidatus Pacearchaeota archaeon]